MTPANILIIDDEAPFVETMSKRLNKRGFKVLCAYSGQEGIDLLESREGGKVDVVILDVKMPGMNGLEALTVIRRKHPLVEVIMLTGHATVESAIEGMKMGAYDYLMKPSEMDVLENKLKMASQNKRNHEMRIVEARSQMIALRRGD